MLAIRLQRTGRKGLAQYRIVVQDSRKAPTSGRVVALLGNYDPHTKKVALKKDKAEFYLKNGARPSDRAAFLLKSEGIALPSWVTEPNEKKRAIRNAEKLRKNQPKEEAVADEHEPAAEAETVSESQETTKSTDEAA